jgi:hypothetical protein
MAGEVGVESVERYHGRAADLIGLIHQSAGAFYNIVDCYRRFRYTDDLAWDRDFEEAGAGTPSAGTDQIYADNVDIAFFAGHGSPNGPFFGVANRDDGQAKPNEVRLGNKDLEWIAWHACSTLANLPGNSAVNRWRNAFQGLHYILGFSTTAWTCGDTLGRRFAQLLNAGWRVRDAWIRASIESQPSGTRTAYIRADLYEPTRTGGRVRVTNTYNDHLWGHGYVSPDPDPESAPGKLQLIFYSTSC